MGELAPFVNRLPPAIADEAGSQRLDEGPMSLRLHQPAERRPRLVEQVLGPGITDVLDGDAPLHRADDRVFGFAEPPFRTKRYPRVELRARQRLEQGQIAGRIEQGAAIRAGDTLGLIGRADFERPAALRALQVLAAHALGAVLGVG